MQRSICFEYKSFKTYSNSHISRVHCQLVAYQLLMNKLSFLCVEKMPKRISFMLRLLTQFPKNVVLRLGSVLIKGILGVVWNNFCATEIERNISRK